MNKPTSLVHEHHVSNLWSWIVIPGTNPYIYIPFPNEFAARQVAAELDRGEWEPETFINYQVTEQMRHKLELPRNIFPKIPDLEGHHPWTPVSAKRWRELADDVTLTRTRLEIHEPGAGTRTLYLTAKRLVHVELPEPLLLPRTA